MVSKFAYRPTRHPTGDARDYRCSRGRGWPWGAGMLLAPGIAPCTREDTERLLEQTERPADIGQYAG